MHHVVLDEWSRRDSPVHRAEARMKIVGALVFLICVATTPRIEAPTFLGYVLLALAGIGLAGLPLLPLAARAAVVLPFSGVFAAMTALAGDTERAAAVVVKSYVSALAVLLLVATTPLPRLLRAAERLGAPRMVILIVQFLYRYLFVISEQAQHMRLAARCRGELGYERPAGWRIRFRGAAGALAVLFGRSYERASAIHQAMLARGFDGRIRSLGVPARGLRRWWLPAAASMAAVAIRLAGRMEFPWPL